MRATLAALLPAVVLILAGCQTTPCPPLALATSVDIHRFMGDWYVIANIPTALEKDAQIAAAGTKHAGSPFGQIGWNRGFEFLYDCGHARRSEGACDVPLRPIFRARTACGDGSAAQCGR